MPWHVQFMKSDGIARISRFPSREWAIEEASRLFDAGCDVVGIGLDRAHDSIDFAHRFRTVHVQRDGAEPLRLTPKDEHRRRGTGAQRWGAAQRHR